jgi:hypothetical protein
MVVRRAVTKKPQRHRYVLPAILLCTVARPGSSYLQSAPALPGVKPRGEVVQASPRKAKAARPETPVAAHRQGAKAALRQIVILPSDITLRGSRASQRLLVQALWADGHQQDITGEAKISSSNSRIVSVGEDNVAVPRGNGETTIRASFAGQVATAHVRVENFDAPFTWSFRNHVLPVMTKMGCNSGACHGAAAGKNGFKLTLRGYDPEIDYYTLTRESLGRRTTQLEPAKSLILLKPTLAIAHGGGQRFPVDSLEYQVVSGWIAAGMPPPRDSDARIQELEVLPREASLVLGAEQQLLVRARFSDGHVEDVTRWAKFTSSDDGVATVDGDGHVRMRGHGEAAISVWYLSLVSFARVRVPYAAVVDPALFRRAQRLNYIDDLVLKKLQSLRIPPSRPATDAEFIRRVYLDTMGVLPTAAEVEEFLADRSPNKRRQLIDSLLERPEFVDYWAYKWSDLLLVSSRRLAFEDTWNYYKWIRDSVAMNKPWDQFVREVVTATGNSRENGATNYWVIHREPTDIAENLAQAFLGISINCAHCHNHPMDKWTQRDYYGMANLFARVRLKSNQPVGSRPNVGPFFQDVTVYNSPSGQYRDERFTRPLPPKPLDAEALPLDSPRERRAYFADWLTSPKNPYFARAVVNRVWRNFMGRGLVEPVDDLRTSNPASNEELMDALVKDFVAQGFDVKHLIRTITASGTYQTASEPHPENAQDEKYGSHYVVRRLAAEVLLDALSQVTQVPEKFEGYPLGMRALQLPDTRVDSYFLTVFGRPPREQTRESERSSEPSITQALHVINGETLNEKIRSPNGTIEMLLKLGFSDERIVEYLFLSALSRYPTDAERGAILDNLRAAEGQKVIGDSPDLRRAALRDLAWAVLTSKEFTFNH